MAQDAVVGVTLRVGAITEQVVVSAEVSLRVFDEVVRTAGN